METFKIFIGRYFICEFPEFLRTIQNSGQNEFKRQIKREPTKQFSLRWNINLEISGLSFRRFNPLQAGILSEPQGPILKMVPNELFSIHTCATNKYCWKKVTSTEKNMKILAFWPLIVIGFFPKLMILYLSLMWRFYWNVRLIIHMFPTTMVM